MSVPDYIQSGATSTDTSGINLYDPATGSQLLDFGQIAEETEVTESELDTKSNSLEILDDIGLSDDIDQDPYNAGIQDSGPLQNLLAPESEHDANDPEDNPPDAGNEVNNGEGQPQVTILQGSPSGEAKEGSSAAVINDLLTGPSLYVMLGLGVLVVFFATR